MKGLGMGGNGSEWEGGTAALFVAVCVCGFGGPLPFALCPLPVALRGRQGRKARRRTATNSKKFVTIGGAKE